jgi:hypothetical protein
VSHILSPVKTLFLHSIFDHVRSYPAHASQNRLRAAASALLSNKKKPRTV